MKLFYVLFALLAVLSAGQSTRDPPKRYLKPCPDGFAGQHCKRVVPKRADYERYGCDVNVVGCQARYGDGFCDEACNKPECLFDGNDCVTPNWHHCKAGDLCLPKFENKVCDPECASPECGYDGGDCRPDAEKSESGSRLPHLASSQLFTITFAAAPDIVAHRLRALLFHLSKLTHSLLQVAEDSAGPLVYAVSHDNAPERIAKEFLRDDTNWTWTGDPTANTTVTFLLQKSVCDHEAVHDQYELCHLTPKGIDDQLRVLLYTIDTTKALGLSVHSHHVVDEPSWLPTALIIVGSALVVFCVSAIVGATVYISKTWAPPPTPRDSENDMGNASNNVSIAGPIRGKRRRRAQRHTEYSVMKIRHDVVSAVDREDDNASLVINEQQQPPPLPPSRKRKANVKRQESMEPLSKQSSHPAIHVPKAFLPEASEEEEPKESPPKVTLGDARDLIGYGIHQIAGRRNSSSSSDEDDRERALRGYYY